MTTAVSTATTTRISVVGRIGLVIAGLLAVGDIVTGIQAFSGAEQALPLPVGVFVLVAGVTTLVLLPFAWIGRRWAVIVLVVVRGLSALTALPAFFVPGVPSFAIIAAAVGILVTAVAIVLVLVGLKARS
ncbi:hypothetical protein BH10ACT7_BH10ACT7_14110 [soil metagenome]